MFLENEQPLVNALEQGLGDVHWHATAYDASLRLRLPMCGVTSLAVAEVMQQSGIDARAVESTPTLEADPTMQHVLVAAETRYGTVLIDPTYSQFLDYVGLSPGYVIFGGEDLFPERKIATASINDGMSIARSLASSAAYFQTHRQKIDELECAQYEMEELSHDELQEQLYKIWNPEFFKPFEPTEPETVEVAHRLAQYILPEHVKLSA